MNGATQIRAGVVRPEVIMPLESDEATELNEEADEISGGMAPGTQVRVIRDPHFGRIGVVANLPVDLETVETESRVRVVEVEFEDKRRVVVPRANVEIIEY
jgi:transcription elongation factor